MTPEQAAQNHGDDGAVEAVVDLAHLDQYTLGDQTLQAELLLLFRDQLRSQAGELASCRDADAWKSAVHTLKGAARSVGANQVAGVAESMEQVAFSDEAGRAALLSRLLAVRTVFEARIEEYL